MKTNRRLSDISSKAQDIRQNAVLSCAKLVLLSSVLSLTACGSATEEQPAITGSEIDMETAKALYFDVKTPDGFYKEARQNDKFYSISHVKNISVLPVVARDGVVAYELASDDFVEAMSWSDTAAEYQDSHKQLSGNTETQLYFEFARFNPDSPEFINMHRVFKASILDRNGVDQSDEDSSYKGRITMPGFTAKDVKLIVEYLWMFTLSNNYSNAVLESYTVETEEVFLHTMKQATLDFSYTESCDAIKVYEVRYTIPKDSGFIWKEKELTHVFNAKRSGTHLEICD